jgi:ATP/maltotriose-dependent transcriptional regulator MalT
MRTDARLDAGPHACSGLYAIDDRMRLPGKLTAPSGAGLIVRARLFEHLDRSGERGVAWVCAPAGAGKTSVLSTWLEARQRFPLWYRMDPDDNDPATFVHYLSQIAAALAPQARPLPPLTPEYLLGIETFARRFFRDFYDALPQPFALVLDDFHLIAADSPTLVLIEVALAEVPRGSIAVLSGRSSPPAALTRSAVCGTVLEWNDLRLDRAEAGALLQQMDPAFPWDVAVLTEATQGWVAGLVLVARAARGSPSTQRVSHEATESLHHYFSREIFSGIDPARRSILLATALLPSFTVEQAQALSGHDDVGEILETLRRGHFFIVRLGDVPPSYQYHPLFLDFLRHQRQSTLPEEPLNQLRGIAAQLAEAAGQYDAAAQLNRDAQAWPQFTALICRIAPELMIQGRHATLAHWIADVPEDVISSSAWLSYWLGMAQIFVDPERATGTLEGAYAAFQREGERDGSILACACVLESIYLRWDDFTPVQQWAARLNAMLPENLRALPLPIAARILAVVPVLDMARHDQHPMLARLVALAEALLADPQAVTTHGVAVGASLQHRIVNGDVVPAQALIDTLLASPDFEDWPPVAQISLLLLFALCASTSARPQDAYQHVERALALAEESGVHVLDGFVLFQGAYAALVLGDTTRAGDWLSRMQLLLRPGSRVTQEMYRHLHATHKILTGDPVGARHDLEVEVEACVRLGVRAGEDLSRAVHGWSLALSGEAPLACALLEKHANRMNASGFAREELLSRTALSYALLAAGERDAARDALALAFRLGRSRGMFLDVPLWAPREMGRLYAEALQAGIEPDHVRRVIQLRGIPAPSPDVESWPWPVRVYTLGRFALNKEDAPIRASGKTQKKPLQLLKALIAMGGRAVPASALAEVLWEDSAEGVARPALDMAVSRLRKLLGDNCAILMQDGKVSLNDKRVWVDVWAFERRVGDFEAQPEGAGLDAAQQALERYTGPFLKGDDEAAWLLERRDRLRSRYLRLVTAYGAALERLGQWHQAADTYRHALEREPLAENIYQ